MEPGQIACPRCQWPVGAPALDAGGAVVCPSCAQRFSVTLFPALFRASDRGTIGERIVDSSQAGCFFHADRRATVACDDCGRFLCALCDLPVAGRHLCPLCLQKGPPRKQETPAVGSQQTTVLYDGIALALAGLPLLMFWLTLLTAPATLFVVWRYWGRVRPAVPRRSRLRFVLAALLALAQIAGWVTLGIALFS